MRIPTATAPPLSLAERDRRWSSTRGVMERQRLDCLVLCLGGVERSPDAEYLAGPDLLARGSCVLPLNGFATAIVGPQESRASAGAWVTDVRECSGALGAALAERVRDVSLIHGRVGLVAPNQPGPRSRGVLGSDFAAVVAESLPKIELVPFSQEVQCLRVVKSEEEVALLARSVSLLDKAFARAAITARPGVRDYEAWASAAGELVRGGSEISVGSRWGSGTRPRLLPRPGHGILQRGSLIVAELEACCAGYRAKEIQSIAVEDCDPIFKGMFTIVSELWQECFGAIKADQPLSDLLEACRAAAARLLPKKGSLNKAVASAAVQGHGLGLDWPSPSVVTGETDSSLDRFRPGWVGSLRSMVELTTQGRPYQAIWSDAIVLREAGPERLGTRPPGLAVATS